MIGENEHSCQNTLLPPFPLRGMDLRSLVAPDAHSPPRLHQSMVPGLTASADAGVDLGPAERQCRELDR